MNPLIPRRNVSRDIGPLGGIPGYKNNGGRGGGGGGGGLYLMITNGSAHGQAARPDAHGPNRLAVQQALRNIAACSLYTLPLSLTVIQPVIPTHLYSTQFTVISPQPAKSTLLCASRLAFNPGSPAWKFLTSARDNHTALRPREISRYVHDRIAVVVVIEQSRHSQTCLPQKGMPCLAGK